jgi:ATP-dependent RNA helicase DHX33
MRKAILPEIQRCSLTFAILHLLAYGQQDVWKFEFMDRPDTEASECCVFKSVFKHKVIMSLPVASALMELYGLGATDDKGKISAFGRKMAALPLEPAQAKVLLASFDLSCSSDIIDLLALLGSADQLLSVPYAHREAAANVRSKFIHRTGDHMMLLNVLKAYEEVRESMKENKERKAWCTDHFLSMKALNQVLDTRKQIRDRVQRLDPSLDCDLSAGDNDEPILSCLLAGLFSNTAIRLPDGSYRRASGNMVSRALVGETCQHYSLKYTYACYSGSKYIQAPTYAAGKLKLLSSQNS